MVFLHVHVDKDLWVAACGLLVERAQAVLQSLYGTADVPVVQLRHHRGRLDGYVGHARVFDEVQRAARAGLCFLFTKDGLTQEVEVQLFAGSGGLFQGVIECIRFRVQHQVANHLAHVQARYRHNQVRQDRAEETAGTDERAIDAAQEGRIVLGRNVLQRLGCNLVILWAHDAVNEVHGELHAIVIAQQLRELLGGLVLFIRGRIEPALCALNGGRQYGLNIIR